MTGKRGSVGGRVEVERDWAQHRIAPLETATPGFTLVNASIDWQPLEARPELSLTLAANNIFDVEARRHRQPAQGLCPARRPRLAPHRALRLLKRLEVDPGGDRFKLADAFLEVGELDPPAGARQARRRPNGGQFEPLIIEPRRAIP